MNRRNMSDKPLRKPDPRPSPLPCGEYARFGERNHQTCRSLCPGKSLAEIRQCYYERRG
jgi:hypothetical protein